MPRYLGKRRRRAGPYRKKVRRSFRGRKSFRRRRTFRRGGRRGLRRVSRTNGVVTNYRQGRNGLKRAPLRRLAVQALLSTVQPVRYFDRDSTKGVNLTLGQALWNAFPLGLSVAQLDKIVQNYESSSTSVPLTAGKLTIFAGQIKHCIRNDQVYPVTFTMWKCYPRNAIPKFTVAAAGTSQAESSPLSADGSTAPPLLSSNYTGFQTDAGTISGAPMTLADPNATPYYNKEWVSYFKLSRPVPVTIQPGQCYNITYKWNSCNFNLQDVYDDGTIASRKWQLLKMKCCGPLLLFRAVGCLGENNAAGVTTGPVSYLRMSDYRWFVNYSAENTQRVAVLNTMNAGTAFKTMMTNDPGFENAV